MDHIEKTDDLELNEAELKSKELRPPSLHSGAIVEHDESTDAPELTKQDIETEEPRLPDSQSISPSHLWSMLPSCMAIT